MTLKIFFNQFQLIYKRKKKKNQRWQKLQIYLCLHQKIIETKHSNNKDLIMAHEIAEQLYKFCWNLNIDINSAEKENYHRQLDCFLYLQQKKNFVYPDQFSYSFHCFSKHS